MPYVQCGCRFCITLHPKVLVVGGTSWLRERAKTQVSAWCGQSACCCSVKECYMREPSELFFSYEPWLPFYSLKGRPGIYMSRCFLLNGETTVPTLLRLVHLVLEGWLTAWLFLYRVTEPCRGRGGRIASTAAHPVNSGKRPQTVVLILPLPLPFYCATVRHSERGKDV